MSKAKASATTLAAIADRWIATTGDIGRLILLSGDLTTGLGYTPTPVDDILTCDSAPNWETGTRVRVTATGTQPTPLLSSTDYFVIKGADFGGTTTEIKLATTLANALAGTPINLEDTGSGTLALNQQQLNETDPIPVLVSREITHPDYGRFLVSGVAAATEVGTTAEKNPVAFSMIVGGGSDPLVFRHFLFLRDALATPGDTTGTEAQLATEAAEITISPGTSKVFTLVFRTKNAV
ncbi:MAG TPA: hypothetical protein V6C64_07630 [Microcoleaceae cyanobacterium]|jgi:hypothetical protein